jgi:hypothetical protein
LKEEDARMLVVHLVLVPLIVLPVFGLLRKRHYRDAVIYAAVSLPGYGLWYCVANHKPFIITLFMEKVIRLFV